MVYQRPAQGEAKDGGFRRFFVFFSIKPGFAVVYNKRLYATWMECRPHSVATGGEGPLYQEIMEDVALG